MPGLLGSSLRLKPAAFMLFVSCSLAATAQNSDFNLDIHANAHATAKDIGLPVYPGAQIFKDKDEQSGADLGFGFNDLHFGLKVINYVTHDPGSKVLDFYRKRLATYGQVLECRGGKPVGSLQRTESGLTCSDKKSGENLEVNGDSSDDHQLRAGTPLLYRMVAFPKTEGQETRFGLLLLQLPKDSGSSPKSD